MMTPRERYIETMTFGKPDKVPFGPGGPRESTLKRWHSEGLPEGVHYMDAVRRELGIPIEEVKPGVGLGVSFQMIPWFEEKVLEHTGGHYICQDWMGAIVEISDQYDYTYIRSAKDFVTRKWHKFPVETREDWEAMKTRFDPNAPGRFPDDFAERCRENADRETELALRVNGPFWQLREWCGFEGLCMLMLDDPDFVTEMAAFWTDFVAETLRPILDGVQPDMVGFNEDMAYKEKSMISPEMTRRFLMPSYLRWVPMIRESGCPVVDMDSDGFIGELIPIWIESGINSCSPMEVAAGNDIVAFRQEFGQKMAYTGGIDKRAIAKGGQVITDELQRVIPPLLADGGYIPGCDHGVPHDISWPNFLDYSRQLAELTGWV